ncbi:M23 family metallopeptidase [Pusillimonas sp. T7-7]|uniref:M23 family metallopeptidase n=1 Tax=Pusillimonas sp. (strain T7-7) TaxID=1007105 RepID=UPI0002E6203E|nr:M23 family metallopeptidase [Pusillimonas sp. T7-7]
MQNQSVDSTAKGLRGIAVALLVVCAMGASAMAGAWIQAQRSVRPVLSAQQERVISEQVLRDSAYVRQNVNLLASKVGDLQAKLIAMGGLSKRVAEVAGVSYTDPEVQASIEQVGMSSVMDDISTEHGASWSAEGLGRELDMMTQQLSEQKDWFAMLDLVLTKRTGVEASLPTYMPVNYPYLSSSFGWRRNPVTGRHTMHEGLDFAAPKGTPIYAASGGVVTQARYATGYGKLVEISHGNGLVTRYAHASSFNVKVGDLVEKGQQIARVGSTGRSTGSHLHFEVRMAGHPLDPTLFLARPQTPGQLVTDASGATQAITAQVR